MKVLTKIEDMGECPLKRNKITLQQMEDIYVLKVFASSWRWDIEEIQNILERASLLFLHLCSNLLKTIWIRHCVQWSYDFPQTRNMDDSAHLLSCTCDSLAALYTEDSSRCKCQSAGQEIRSFNNRRLHLHSWCWMHCLAFWWCNQISKYQKFISVIIKY